MSVILASGAVDMQGLRLRLYDVLGMTYSGVSPAPACLPLLQLSNMISTPSGHYRCRGRVRGKGFEGRRFSVQEIRAIPNDTESVFDGIIVSLSHTLRTHGRTVIVPDHGALNPTHIDGMKRVGVPSRVFEKAFEIYADDQTEGRMVTPPDFLERLLKFDPMLKEGHGSIAFSGRQMHVVLQTGGTRRFSEDMHFDHIEEAAKKIATEMINVFDLIAAVDELASKANRHCPVERNRAREDFYMSASQSIEPVVMKALTDGTLQNDRRAKYLTKDAFMVDPALRGMLMPKI